MPEQLADRGTSGHRVRGTEGRLRGGLAGLEGHLAELRAVRAYGTGMSRAAKVPGVSINDLTDPERLDGSGNAALNGVPVTVTQT